MKKRLLSLALCLALCLGLLPVGVLALEEAVPSEDSNTDYVASVTTSDGESTNYTSLDDALNAAQDGDTVTLLSDVDLGETYVTISKSITFDLNGKTLSSSKAWLDYGVLLVKDATVTVKNGTVKAAEMSSCAIRAYGSGASMTLEDVTATVTSDESSVMVGDFGSAVIKSGDYQGLYVGAKSQVTLEGGTFRPYMDTITTNENVKSIFWKVNETTDTTSRDCNTGAHRRRLQHGRDRSAGYGHRCAGRKDRRCGIRFSVEGDQCCSERWNHHAAE